MTCGPGIVNIVNLMICLRLSIVNIHTTGEHGLTKRFYVSEMIIKYACIWFSPVTSNKRYM